MALNSFTIDEAIDICTKVRDALEFDFDLPLKERWREKDALAFLINIAEKEKERLGK